jgi:Mn2+/Fe2+ NRAMP family transporter
MGWEGGVNKRFTEAPQFYVTYSLVILVGAVVALSVRQEALVPVMLFSQVANGVLLPVVVFLMLRITSDPSIMGGHVNGRLFQAVAVLGASLVALLSLAMVGLTLVG